MLEKEQAKLAVSQRGKVPLRRRCHGCNHLSGCLARQSGPETIMMDGTADQDCISGLLFKPKPHARTPLVLFSNMVTLKRLYLSAFRKKPPNLAILASTSLMFILEPTTMAQDTDVGQLGSEL